MIFNDTFRMGATLPPLSQEEILNTPEFYCMSLVEILDSGKCPSHLGNRLRLMPWTGRPNFIQVRIQDMTQTPRGSYFHVDVNTILANGIHHCAKSFNEFRSMTVSFGDVVEAEFIKEPFEMDLTMAQAVSGAYQLPALETVSAKPNQIVTYSSRDFHRCGLTYRNPGNVRLIIVSVELDDSLPEGSGYIK
jgi:hypothetical protein